jgi:ABC-type lipoprotein release transport system permease subunit
MDNKQLAIIIIIILVGATALIVSLAVAAQMQRDFEQRYAMQQFYSNLLNLSK